MPDITIPDAAVEAAARAAYEYGFLRHAKHYYPLTWEEIGDGARESWRAIVRAAAPHIAAQVASDIHGQFGVNVSDEMSDWWDGYRQAQRDVLRKLREIEAYYRIEADHG